jgi:hypothetical protein
VPTPEPMRDLMPTISTFMGITITMYFDDHDPPHFHAQAAEHAAKIRIDNLETIESNMRRREMRLVLARAELHAAELASNWRRAREGVTLQPIDPLR